MLVLVDTADVDPDVQLPTAIAKAARGMYEQDFVLLK